VLCTSVSSKSRISVFLPVVLLGSSLLSLANLILHGGLYFLVSCAASGLLNLTGLALRYGLLYWVVLNIFLSQASTHNFSMASYLVKLYLIFN
jgi:hypothetical protein